MPSKKKARGKVRKAVKEAKEVAAKAKEGQALVAANQQEKGSLEAQMFRLQINVKCEHGSPVLSHVEENILQDFIDEFVDVAYNYSEAGASLGNAFYAAHEATKDEYSDVYYSQIEIVISALLANWTHCILNGITDRARVYAALACFFEEWREVTMRKTKATLSWAKIVELDEADDHTLIRFFMKRVPCSCLNKKYKEVKSAKKVGKCCNPSCSLPGRNAERCKMFYCTRCGEANYCSIECQKAAWKIHKDFCYRTMKLKSAFDSDQQS